MPARSMRNSNQICMVATLGPDVRKNFTVRPRPLPWPKFLVTRMLTRDLLAGANLPVFTLHLTGQGGL